MRKLRHLLPGMLLGVLALVPATPASAQRLFGPKAVAPSAQRQAPLTLAGDVAELTGLTEKETEAIIKVLGPAISERLSRGERVELPGLGVFRVVRIPAYRDLVDGRPAEIPASNYVEFLPYANVVAAANAATAEPAVTVPAFQYIPLPGRVPSDRVPSQRMPSIRTR